MRGFSIVLMVVLLAAGCAGNKKEEAERRQAFMAGQQQALQANRAAAQKGPVVYFQGAVRNPVVPWTDGLMLSQALVSAYYTGFMNPMVVRVIRHGQVVVDMKGIDLLHHEDAPLQAGDTVVVIE